MKTPFAAPSFIMLAPMEGVIDHTMREMLCSIGGIDRCVTEFFRVSQQPLSQRTLRHSFPELDNHCQTSCATPVYLQLLGDDPELMAQSALNAARMGVTGVDLNFGCPSKTVNHSGGGAFLLQKPETVFAITHAVRQALPAEIPLTAKMRLGYEDKSLAIENALALEQAGVTEIAIHARTKTEGYRPPAHWDEIGKIADIIRIPIIANGEIWNLEDLQRCQQESKCRRIMLGRGLVACPDLALHAKGQAAATLGWGEISLLLLHFFNRIQPTCPPQYINSTIKQWLSYLRFRYIDAHVFFDAVKRLKKPEELHAAILAEIRNRQKTGTIRTKAGKLDLEEELLSVSRPGATYC